MAQSNLLQMQNIHKAFSTKVLFNDETFSINEGEHVGVIGPNGAGKSTLFKSIIGSEELDSGKVIKSQRLRLGYLPQHDQWNETETIEQFLEKDSTLPMWDVKQLGIGLGLKDENFDQPIVSFSGGYRMRVKLLAMLAQEPNLMLLDEPTNYLDLETMIVLEGFLRSYRGAFLLISHDRTFLRKTVNHILELENAEIVKFSGGLDKYLEQKKLWLEEYQKRYESLEAEKKEIIDFARRFGAKASKAKQVQSRLKRLEKMEEMDQKASKQRASMRIPEPARTGKVTLQTKNMNLGYDSKVILKSVNLEIKRGDHIGVVGVNGAGKTTLLKGLSKNLTPLSGETIWGHNIEISYYAQHVVESLDLEHDVYDAIMEVAYEGCEPQEVKSLAGAFLFSGEDINKKLSVLSGGELARVALARLLIQKKPCLILDEPTNHLDFETVETLAKALSKYSGTLIIVSHDRDFVRQVSSQILEIRNGEVQLYRGTYDEYLWSIEKGGLSDLDNSSSSDSKNTSHKVAKKNKPQVNQKELRKQIRQLKKDGEKFEQKIAKTQSDIEEKSSVLSIIPATEIPAMAKDIEVLQTKVMELESLWETSLSELENLEAQLI